VAVECEEDTRIGSDIRAGVEIRECETTLRIGGTSQVHGGSDGTCAEKETNREIEK
jgi:hypothetical protein